MYCSICGTKLPEGLTQCPQCTDAKNQLLGQTFGFHYESGMSSNTTTEIDHTVTLQDGGLLIESQKSYTLFRKRSKPVVTQSVPYSTIQSVRLNTSMSMIELITSVGFGIIGLIYLFDGSVFWGLFWLVLCGLAVKAGIRTMVTIRTANGAPVRIPYSGNSKELAVEFAKSICLITGISMPSV